MRLLEDLPAVEDDFEMLLSRRVSTNTEFEEANMGSQPMNESLLNEVALKVTKIHFYYIYCKDIS